MLIQPNIYQRFITTKGRYPNCTNIIYQYQYHNNNNASFHTRNYTSNCIRNMSIQNNNTFDIVMESKKLFAEFSHFYSNMSQLPIHERKIDDVERFGTRIFTNDCIFIYFWGAINHGRNEWITTTKGMVPQMPYDPNTTMTITNEHVVLATDTKCVLNAKAAFTNNSGTLMNYATIIFTTTTTAPNEEEQEQNERDDVHATTSTTTTTSKPVLKIQYYHESNVVHETTVKMT